MQIAPVNITILTEPVHYLLTGNVILITQYKITPAIDIIYQKHT